MHSNAACVNYEREKWRKKKQQINRTKYHTLSCHSIHHINITHTRCMDYVQLHDTSSFQSRQSFNTVYWVTKKNPFIQLNSKITPRIQPQQYANMIFHIISLRSLDVHAIECPADEIHRSSKWYSTIFHIFSLIPATPKNHIRAHNIFP